MTLVRVRDTDLCFHTDAAIRAVTKDKYGRTVVRVECRGTDANLAMVKAGMAWAYTKYQTDPAFPRAELAARRQRIGLWVDLGTKKPPIAPWDFRHYPPAPTPDATGCFTGPKGGRYRIVNGRKRYGC